MKKYYLIFALIFYSLSIVSQNKKEQLRRLVKDFNSLTENQNQDVIYFQTSKDIYKTEEDLWFKAYILDSQYLFPSKRDKVLFIQFMNDVTKKVVWEERYEIENGFADGHIFIDKTLTPGNYSLNAYTQHSYFKSQKEFYALKKVTIFNDKKNRINTPLFINDTIAQFSLFPEGGYLVSKLNNKLAFKAINKQGLPVNVSGTLFENNVPLLKFKSVHEGMGQFFFKPDKTKKYHIQLNQQKDTVYKIPEIKNFGKTLSIIANTDSILKIKISQSKELPSETIYLRLQIKGVIYTMASAQLKENVIINLSLKDLPQGIAEITLFNKNLQPIAERLVYVKLNEQLQIKSTLLRNKFKTREKVVVNIKTTNSKNEPVVAHLGLSVFEQGYKNEFESKSILSHYHLSTQLKGNIYNPSYYFNKENSKRKKALDLLLLTQGWRRYIWHEENLKIKKNQLKPLVFNNLYGKIVSTRKKVKTQNSPMYLGAFSVNKNKRKKLIAVDSLRNFSITPDNLKIGEKDYLLLKLYTLNKAKYNISFDDTAFKKINNYREHINFYYPIDQKKITEEIKPFAIEKSKVLDEVTVTRSVNDSFLQKLNNLAKNELTFDFVCGINHLNCPFHKGKRDKKPVAGVSYLQVLFFQNGTWLESENPIRGVPHKTINLPPYTYPKFTEKELLEMFKMVKIKGFYGKREFYKPTYDEISIKDPFPDYRNTLFWKPDIITDKNGKATVVFFTSDIYRTFTGQIEGVTQQGLLGQDSFKFKVLKRQY